MLSEKFRKGELFKPLLSIGELHALILLYLYIWRALSLKEVLEILLYDEKIWKLYTIISSRSDEDVKLLVHLVGNKMKTKNDFIDYILNDNEKNIDVIIEKRKKKNEYEFGMLSLEKVLKYVLNENFESIKERDEKLKTTIDKFVRNPGYRRHFKKITVPGDISKDDKPYCQLLKFCDSVSRYVADHQKREEIIDSMMNDMKVNDDVTSSL